RVFHADGSAATPEITVATFPNGANSWSSDFAMPEVAMAGNGIFMVAWQTRNGSLGVNSIYAQAYRANGSLAGNGITVLAGDATTTGDLSGVAADASGNFVVLYALET